MVVRAYAGKYEGGSVDGAAVIVVAWQPSLEDMDVLNKGGLIYLSVMGSSLPPHYLSTDFHSATHPA